LVLAGYDELTGALIVSVVLADKRPIAALSDASVGHKMEISMDGKLLMTSVLREPLRDGSFQMTSSSQDEVRALTAQFAHGPVTLVIDVAD
jgi:preprotein translocase subunit SecD